MDEIPLEISLEELRYEQAINPEIADLLTIGGSGRSPVIDVNEDGIAIRKAHLDDCEQILVPLALRPPFLYLEHYPKSQTEKLPSGEKLVKNPWGLKNDATGPRPTEIDEPEYVLDKIVGLRKADDGTWRYRVRWYGYTRENDTWETADHIPDNVVRRYHRRVGLPLEN
jgi:Chromo (CHRromatin Organisation MOdifier) domain